VEESNIGLQSMDFFNRQSVHLIVAANQMESDENK
jgi:hypothetical protein